MYTYIYIYSIYTHTLCILGTAATGKSPEEDGHRSSWVSGAGGGCRISRKKNSMFFRERGVYNGDIVHGLYIYIYTFIYIYIYISKYIYIYIYLYNIHAYIWVHMRKQKRLHVVTSQRNHAVTVSGNHPFSWPNIRKKMPIYIAIYIYR